MDDLRNAMTNVNNARDAYRQACMAAWIALRKVNPEIAEHINTM